jgi:hypothetical protein
MDIRSGTGVWTGHLDAPVVGANANLYTDGQPIQVRT